MSARVAPRVLRVTFVSVLLTTAAHAQPAADDGYCDYVEGAASAEAASLMAPQLFTQFGYIEQPAFTETPGTDTSNLRLLAGLRYSLTNIYAGSATKSRASADCRRHSSLQLMRNATTLHAVTARLQVLEGSLAEAERLLKEVNAEFEARRATIPEATSMRLRVEELRSLAGNARRELAALPAQDQRPLGAVIAQFRAADADVEKNEGKLRSIKAYDISIRGGVDRFLDGDMAATNYFGVVQVGVNLGALWSGSGNRRAASGRKRYAATQDPLNEISVDQLRAMIEADTQRSAQLTTLTNDLGQQLEGLAKLGTEDSRRYRATLWFDWVKAKADLAYLQANIEGLRQLLGVKAP